MWCCRLLKSHIVGEHSRITSPPLPPLPPTCHRLRLGKYFKVQYPNKYIYLKVQCCNKKTMESTLLFLVSFEYYQIDYSPSGLPRRSWRLRWKLKQPLPPSPPLAHSLRQSIILRSFNNRKYKLKKKRKRKKV